MNRLLKFRDDYPFYYYVVMLLVVYGIWKGFKEFYYSTDQLQQIGWRFNDYLAHLHQYFISWVLDLINVMHQKFIVTVSYGTFPGIRLPHSGGVYIGHHCLAVTVSIVYAVLIVLLKGSIWRKLIFIPIGLFSIFLINSARLMVLIYLDKYASPTIFEIHHNIINVIIVYTYTLFMHIFFMAPVLRAYYRTARRG